MKKKLKKRNDEIAELTKMKEAANQRIPLIAEKNSELLTKEVRRRSLPLLLSRLSLT